MIPTEAFSDMEARQSAEAFWEQHYRKAASASNGRPSTALAQFGKELAPGKALDLGCSRGDDAVWLARNGWKVVAIDVSATVLRYAAENAARSGVADRIRFEHCDLAASFPVGRFDLVTALYLESPVAFPREQVLRRAADAVEKGGTLLIVEHGSRAPWSWGNPDLIFPTAQQSWDALKLNSSEWLGRFVGTTERIATGPGGQTALVCDNLLVLQRRIAG
jgi:SAM-dependent methyltransferase